MSGGTIDVDLKCECGAVRGIARDVGPSRGNRIVCMCDDCQTFSAFLSSDLEFVDAHGGTDIFQMTPAQIEITDGFEHVSCVRLSPKGMLRWYAGCCRTPIGNTMSSPKVPFVGVVHAFMDHEARGRTRSGDLGPVIARVQGRFGRGPLPEDAHPSAPFGLIVRTLRFLIVARLRGRHRPSPFFDGSTGEPRATPQVLTHEERADFQTRSGAAAL